MMRKEGGFTLLEVMFAAVIVCVAILGLVSAISYSSSLNESSRDTMIAMNGAKKVMEEIRGTTFALIYDTFKSGGTTGNDFDVEGLVAQDDDADGSVGEIIFYTDETANSGTAADLGFPRDLNGDGDSLDTSVTTEYKILVVEVKVKWVGIKGDTSKSIYTIIADREGEAE